MDRLLGYAVALMWGLTTVCAGIGYGRSIKLMMQGVEPSTDWMLVIMLVCACVFTGLAAGLVED